MARTNPPLPPAIPFAIGAAVAVYLKPGATSRIIALSACAALLAAACYCGTHSSSTRSSSDISRSDHAMGRNVRLRAGFLFALSLGLLLGTSAHARVDTWAGRASPGLVITTGVLACDGMITADPRRTASGMTAVGIELLAARGRDGARVTASGPLLVYVRGGGPATLIRGQIVSVGLRKPATPARGGAGAWPDALAVPAAFVDGGDVAILAPASALERMRWSIRSALLASLNRAGGVAGPLLEALIVGVRDDLDGSIADDFRKAGCAHILALSGQHIGILATLVAVLLGFLVGPFRARAAACVLAGAYLCIVGASPAVARAVIMFWIGSAALLLDRPHAPLAVLALAFTAAVILFPQSVHALSFKLSYLAVAGIALFAPSYEFRLRRWLPPPISGAVAMGLAALAATAPLSIIAFGYLNPFSPLSSALAGPLVSALMYCGLAGVTLVAAIPAAAPLAAWLCSVPYELLTGTIRLGAAMPAVAVATGGAPATALASVVALGATFVYAWPHVAQRPQSRHRTAAGQLRLADRSVRPAGAAGPGHAQEVRPELPCERTGQTSHRRAARGGARRPRVGNWPGNRLDDP
ncbi:MAG TPA: ComEC/Rec2 family competence protein [bacterium]|nr:ComEC/Rec2 family competence protein [bacterium]